MSSINIQRFGLPIVGPAIAVSVNQEGNPTSSSPNSAIEDNQCTGSISNTFNVMPNESVIAQEQELLLGRLKLKIEEKQNEFESLKLSGQLSPEELIDYDRARARIMRPYELTQSEVLKQHPNQFFSYVNKLLDEILPLDVRQLNMLLACTVIQTVKNFKSKFYYDSKLKEVHEEERVERLLPDFVNGTFKYMSGFPVVIRLSEQPKKILLDFTKESCKSREDGLSVDDIKKIEEAFSYISQIDFSSHDHEPFSATESIIIVESSNVSGIAGDSYVSIVKVNDTKTAKETMQTILHEDCHKHQTHKDQRRTLETKFSKENGSKKIASPWGDLYPYLVLDEIDAYKYGNSSVLDTFEKIGFDPEKDFNLLRGIILESDKRNLAINQLLENKHLLGDAGTERFNELIKTNSDFNDRLSGFVRDKITSYLDQTNSFYRLDAIRILDLASTKSTSFHESIQDRYITSVKNDKSPYLITTILKTSGISQALNQAAIERFNSEGFQGFLSSAINSCFSEGKYKTTGYMYIKDGYTFSLDLEKKGQYLELFKERISLEADIAILKKLELNSNPVELKILIDTRIEELQGDKL